MDSEQFREFGKAAIDVIANYYDTLRDRNVLPSTEPGDLIQRLPENAPEKPEDWKDVLKDFQELIIKDSTHWQSPQFHAYFACSNSYANIVGTLLSNGLGVNGTSWIASPACTEVEVLVLNWLGKLMGLPEHLLNCSPGPGGGIIQGSASESTLVCLFAARNKKLCQLKEKNIYLDEVETVTKLVLYTSDQSNSSVEKDGLLASMNIRLLKTDSNHKLRPETLKKAIEDDKALGLIPCTVVACFGTTGTCAFDSLEELGPICREEGMWVHVDAAYAGTALICPEYRYLMKDLEYADSFVFNAHKWLLVNFCCSVMWVKDSNDLIKTFDIRNEDTSLNNFQNKSTMIPDYRQWQIAQGRKFRSLKLWCVLKNIGSVNIRQYIRTQVNQARYFANLVQSDCRLIVEPEPVLGVVCFRLKDGDFLTEKLLRHLVNTKKIFMVATTYRNHLVIRFVICSQFTQYEDVDKSWKIIRDGINYVLKKKSDTPEESFLHKNRRTSLDVTRM